MPTWIGGTQSPLMRGYLRAAVVRARGITEPTLFDVHTIDTAGLEQGTTRNVSIRSHFPKKMWRPLTLEDAFDPHRTVWALGGTHPCANITVGGLDLTLFCNAFVHELRRREERLANLARFVGLDERAVHERTAALLRITTDMYGHGCEHWGTLMMALGTRMLSMPDVSLGTTDDYWSMNAFEAHPERFSVLDRFLADPELRERYAKVMHRDTPEIPYFVIYFDQNEKQKIRRPLVLDGSTLRLGSVCIEDIRGIQSASTLFFALRHKFPCIAPKAVPLYAQLRANGILYGKAPAYEKAGKALVAALGIEAHPTSIIRFDLARALGRGTWRLLCRYMREEGSRSGFAPMGPNKARNSCSISQYWQHRPVLLDLWLLGGDDVVRATVETATLGMRR